MQTTSSKKIEQKSGSIKQSKTSGPNASSRTRNTSDSGNVAGGRLSILIDDRNVTPKSLAPLNPKKDAKPDDETGAAAADNEGAGEDEVPEDVPPPPPTKGKPQKAPGLTKDELDKNVDLILSETETDTLLSFPSVCVQAETKDYEVVAVRNKAYDELVNSKADSDQYRDQHCQTINLAAKAKEVLAAPPQQEHMEVNANLWDIYDTFATDPVPKHVQIQAACEKESAAAVALAIKKPGCLFSMDEPYPTDDYAKKEAGAPTAKGKSGQVRKAGAKSGGSGAVSKSLSSEKADSQNMPGEGNAEGGGGELGAGASGNVVPPASGDVTSPPAVADEKDAEEEEKEEAPKAPVDPIPWKIGGNNPIPEELSEALRVMERIVSQNVFHRQHMIYRDYPTLDELAKLDEMRADDEPGQSGGDGSGNARKSVVDSQSADGGDGGGEELEAGEQFENEEVSREETSSDKAKLQDLFCFDAPQLTQGVNVTSAEWNKHNQDLLAVSYGDTAPVPNITGGLVLFWSLKNPTYPERVIRTRTGVTALHFSSVHPNMVAAGTHDGSVMIWDLRRPTDVPVLQSGSSVSTHNDQKHTDIVWETKWVDRGDRGEALVSTSSDGCVYQWSMKKGLEQTPLMSLKRLQNPFLGANSVYGHKEGIVFHKSSGFCADFPRGDASTYLVGTEDGLIHRCSTSYNEQYLATYLGHSGPVYRVRCNPFVSHAFLTCSADWSMKLWSTKAIPGHPANTHLFNFMSTDLCDSVNDVIWAPHNSTSFAACMDDGRVELWDLSEKPLDPIVVHYPRDLQFQRRRTCVRFSPNSPVLIAGDDNGSVDVMRMYNTDTQLYSDEEQQDRLNAVMVKKR